VAHDITLDGNMWKASHHVNRRPFVADFGRGVTVSRGRWKFALASYIRTREFDGQAEPPNFGSFTASYRF
jgi:hypothetical protein